MSYKIQRIARKLIMNSLYYTYYSYEQWGRGYIGVRKCPTGKTPNTDSYMGSYRDKTFNPTDKIILSTYDNYEAALKDEIILHNFYEVNTNTHFANKAKQSSNSFYYIAEGKSNYQYNKGKVYNFYNPCVGVEYNRTCSYMHNKYSLDTSSLLLLSKSSIKSHKGWVLLGNKIPNTALKHYKYTWKHFSDYIEHKSPLEISAELKVHISIVVEIAHGKRKKYKGLECLYANLQPDTCACTSGSETRS